MYTAPGLTYEAAEADPRSHIYPPAYHDAGRTEKDSIWTRHSHHATSSRSGLRCCVTMQIESPEGHSDHPLHSNNKITGQHWGIWPCSWRPHGMQFAVVVPCTAAFRCTSSELHGHTRLEGMIRID
jgi:hypothetical protein